MRNFNFKPLGLGNVFESRKLYYVTEDGPCMGSIDSVVNENSCLCLTEEDNNGCPLTIPKDDGFNYAGVSYCEDSQIVRYYPKKTLAPLTPAEPVVPLT